jgi:hypothetical protein
MTRNPRQYLDAAQEVADLRSAWAALSRAQSIHVRPGIQEAMRLLADAEREASEALAELGLPPGPGAAKEGGR